MKVREDAKYYQMPRTHIKKYEMLSLKMTLSIDTLFHRRSWRISMISSRKIRNARPKRRHSKAITGIQYANLYGRT
jgi:hypothetical protein